MTTPKAGPSPSVFFFCSFPPPFTGQNVSTLTFYDLLSERVAVDRIDTSDAGALHREEGGLLHEVRYLISLVKRLVALRRAARTRRPDVLYLVLSSSTLGRIRDAAYLMAARRYVGRVVGHIHVGDFHRSFERPALGLFSRYLLRHVDRFLFLSPRLAERSRPFVAERQRAIVPNTLQPVMNLAEEALEARWEARRHRTTLRVAFVSNMIPTKGYAVVAEAVAAYNRANPALPAEVDFVGGWPTDEARRTFEGRLVELDLTRHARVHGAVMDRPWIRRLYMEADVLVLPTTYPHEAQPLCIIEAFAAGVPVVATDHASIPDMVDAQNGVLLEEASAKAVAGALAVLAEPDVWERRARGARATFEAQFSRRAVLRTLEEALGLPLAEPRLSRRSAGATASGPAVPREPALPAAS